MTIANTIISYIDAYIPLEQREAWEQAIGSVRTFDCHCTQLERRNQGHVAAHLAFGCVWGKRLNGTMGAVGLGYREPEPRLRQELPLGHQILQGQWLIMNRANSYYYYNRTDNWEIALAVQRQLPKELLPPYFDNGAPWVETFARKRFEEITAITNLLKQTGRSNCIQQYHRLAWVDLKLSCPEAFQYGCRLSWFPLLIQ